MTDTRDESGSVRRAAPTTDPEMREEVFAALFSSESGDADKPAVRASGSFSWVRRLRERARGRGPDELGLPTYPGSLRFRDEEVEREYRRKLVPRVRKQLRASLTSSLVMWPIGGAIGYAVAHDGRSFLVAVPTVLIFLIALLAAERRTTSVEGLTINGAVSNTVPGLLCLVMVWFEGVFGGVGALLSVLVMAFGFTLLNLPFVASVLAAAPYTVTAVVMCFSLAGVPVPAFQAFLLVASFAVLATGAYGRESAARRDFFLTRVIADQERELVEERQRQLGQYTLQAELGRGGMGVVHKARHAMLRRPTAVKILSTREASADQLARFEQEVQLTSELSHPNIVAIFDYGRSPAGEFYYAMEFIAGMDLETLVRDHGPLPAGRAVPILAQICAALHEAHARGLVHRDIKPANVLISRTGTRCDAIKVVDFGLVKQMDDRDDAPAGIAGTPTYIAPEIVEDPSAVTPANDIYALGALAFFLLTGKRVVEGRTVFAVLQAHLEQTAPPPSKLAPEPVPKALDAWVASALTKDPASRPTAKDLGDALAEIAVANPVDLAAWWDRFEPDEVAPAAEAPAAGTLTVVLDDR